MVSKCSIWNEVNTLLSARYGNSGCENWCLESKDWSQSLQGRVSLKPNSREYVQLGYCRFNHNILHNEDLLWDLSHKPKKYKWQQHFFKVNNWKNGIWRFMLNTVNLTRPCAASARLFHFRQFRCFYVCYNVLVSSPSRGFLRWMRRVRVTIVGEDAVMALTLCVKHPFYFVWFF